MERQRYSHEFMKAAVEKVMNRGSRPMTAIQEELGICQSSLYRWRAAFGIIGSMKKISQRPHDRSAREKLKAVIEYANLPPDRQGEYLRKEGLHAEHLEGWRKQLEAALAPVKMTKSERTARAEDRRKIVELEKELRRKDKALAETTALLVLKKKANLIWGTGEDE